jgi:hypothetical protein
MRTALHMLIGAVIGSLVTIGVTKVLQKAEATKPRGAVLATPAQAVTPEARLGRITGEVFIVTKGRANIRLGLVEVRALREADALVFLDKKKDEARMESERLNQQLAQANRELAGARHGREKTVSDDLRDFRAMVKAPLDVKYNGKKGQEAIEAANAEERRRGNVVSSLVVRLEQLKRAEFSCSQFPEGIASTKTDSAGRFELTVPRNEVLVLAATASRVVFEKTENYCWFLRATLGGTETKKILLSNDNTTDSGAAESLLQTSH